MYRVKEVFYTLQGEGANAGRAAVFCRFSGCNLWSGREAQRLRARCQFCDTDFVGTDGPGGGVFESAASLGGAIAETWRGDDCGRRLVVCTGGEPLMQLDGPLVAELRNHGFDVAVETNGTQAVPSGGVDWICVSPKARTALRLTSGDELKLVYPQEGGSPERYETLNFKHFFLQPMDGPEVEANTRAAIEYCLSHPNWRLSIQMHKAVGIP